MILSSLLFQSMSLRSLIQVKALTKLSHPSEPIWRISAIWKCYGSLVLVRIYFADYRASTDNMSLGEETINITTTTYLWNLAADKYLLLDPISKKTDRQHKLFLGDLCTLLAHLYNSSLTNLRFWQKISTREYKSLPSGLLLTFGEYFSPGLKISQVPHVLE